MAFNYNHITLVGRLARDPESEKVGDTIKASFSIAIDRPWRKDDGTKETDFVSVRLWGRLAETASRSLKKDAPVLVEGRLQIREYEKNGERRWISEVVGENFQILKPLTEK